jgi:hypothetical protein
VQGNFAEVSFGRLAETALSNDAVKASGKVRVDDDAAANRRAGDRSASRRHAHAIAKWSASELERVRVGARQMQCHVRADLRFGTFLPFLRASERPIAMACLRLLTVLPLLPLFSVPFLRLRMAPRTSLAAPRE